MKPSKPSNTRTKVNYARLTHALRSLGYEELRASSHVVFAHPKTRVRLILPAGRRTDQVDRVRMAGVYQLVTSGGVVSRSELDTALAKTASAASVQAS